MSDDEEYTPCYCVHCTPGGELCPRCHPESRDGTVCVRLDGLADQIAAEIHDELVRAAICYAAPAGMRKDKPYSDPETVFIPMMWPWAFKHWKPTADDRVRELVKAAVFLAA